VTALEPILLARTGAWLVTGLGLGLVVWSGLRERDAVGKVRFLDCGVVLLFSSILVRLVAQEGPMTAFDWAMVFLAPVFIAAALWRLNRTRMGR
jgi:hypothetical protein